ncbi:MAG TPA: hypothetical protein VLA74_10740 [Nitrososphaeraceae archaeon]|nr:hypothetical protein [Nitrososphaeraceae archaeon]
MNSRQGSRYIKRRMGDELKNEILVRNGIIQETEINSKPSVLNCHRCQLVNAIENKYCSKCSYPLTPQAFEEIKTEEDKRMRILEEKQKEKESEIQTMKQQIALLIESQKEIIECLKYPNKLLMISEG